MGLVLPKEHHSFLERLATLVEDGGLVPSVERTYPLNEAADAMRHLVAGKVRGQLVIEI